MTSDAPPVMFVRLLPGVVGERDRVVHIVPAPTGDVLPAFLQAYCDAQFGVGSAELLAGPLGMPCFACLMRAPLARTAGVTIDAGSGG